MTTEFRAGFVALVGRPNVGKSTLINWLLKQKIAAVSARPQTTRRRQFGILTLEHAQVVLVDTPGIHQPVHDLGKYMNETALDALQDADAILWLVDSSEAPTAEDELVASHLAALKPLPPTLLALNKADLVPAEQRAGRQAAFQALLPTAQPLAISASTGEQCQVLIDWVVANIPVGEAFYDADQITDLYEKEIAADLIREACLRFLRDEVPHAIAVRIDEYKERGEDGAYIAATLFVEKESQKAIVIGSGGEMLKKIGTTARREIETMSGRKVFVELRVKVSKNWRSDPNALHQFGFTTEKE